MATKKTPETLQEPKPAKVAPQLSAARRTQIRECADELKALRRRLRDLAVSLEHHRDAGSRNLLFAFQFIQSADDSLCLSMQHFHIE